MNSIAKSITLILMLILPSFGFSQRNGSKIMDFRNIDYRLLNTWIEFSKISSNYIENECQQLWDKMKKEHLTMGTLRWWAKQDNIQKYNEIINNSILPLIDTAISSLGAHYDVAKVVQGIYKGEYKDNKMNGKGTYKWSD
jgi:hypothetical protein